MTSYFVINNTVSSNTTLEVKNPIGESHVGYRSRRGYSSVWPWRYLEAPAAMRDSTEQYSPNKFDDRNGFFASDRHFLS